MVSGLVLTLALGVFQLALALHVRNTLTACAAEGARLGARADSGPGEGERRTRSLIASSLSGSYAGDVHSVTTGTQGMRVVQVTVTAPLPVIGLIGPSETLTVTARALAEQQ